MLPQGNFLLNSGLYLGTVSLLFSIYSSKNPPYLRFFSPVSRPPAHLEETADLIGRLLITFSRWLMGLLNKTGPNASWCFYSGPFCRVICCMARVSFHYFSVVFGNPFSPLLCSELSNSTLIQFIGVNHTWGERRLFILISTHYPSYVSFTCKVLENRLAIIISWERKEPSC